MAIRDLLWACPGCGTPRGLVPHAEGDACEGCDLVFRRGGGSRIECMRPGGEVIARPAGEWVDLLPDMAAVAAAESSDPTAEVEARFAVGTTVVRTKKEYLGRIEDFGPVMRGSLSVGDRGARFQPAGKDGSRSPKQPALQRDSAPVKDSRGSRRGVDSPDSPLFRSTKETKGDDSSHSWTFDDITAIQASSSTLQLRFRGEPVISFRFPGGSLRFWELRLQYAVQRRYDETGRGTIREFQPRIVT